MSGKQPPKRQDDPRLVQLLAESLAQRTLLQSALGAHAMQSEDWRDAIEDYRMMSDYAIKNAEGSGVAAETIRRDAIHRVNQILDELHEALSSAEYQGLRRPPPPIPSES